MIAGCRHAIQPTDIAHTGAYYAEAALRRGDREVVIAPYIGREAAEPFVERGIAVSAIGCIAALIGSHDECARAQAALRRYDGWRVMDCADTAAFVALHKNGGGRYRTVVVDPPWPIEKIQRRITPNQIDMDYRTMPIAEIRGGVWDGWDIRSAFADDCFVFLWTTQKYLPAAFCVIDAWGLTYRFTMGWHKHGGFQVFGYPQFNLEFILVASKGNPKFTDLTGFNVAFQAPRGRHSEKPEAFYELLRRVAPPPRLDVFNRRAIAGFDYFGDEAGHLQPLLWGGGKRVGHQGRI